MTDMRTQPDSLAREALQRDYGDPVVREIIKRATQFEWFVQPMDTAFCQQRASRHIEVLAGSAALHSSSIELVQGALTELPTLYRAANPVARRDDPAYARGSWRNALGETLAAVRGKAESSEEVRSRFEPPLFPFKGQPGIAGGMLVADRRAIPDEGQEETMWYFMCDVDADFWSAITWQLIERGRSEANPFFGLVEMYANGCYPIGFVDGRFIIFTRR